MIPRLVAIALGLLVADYALDMVRSYVVPLSQVAELIAAVDRTGTARAAGAWRAMSGSHTGIGGRSYRARLVSANRRRLSKEVEP